MPFSSAACQTCKNRRVKCDETEPICKRCSKSDRLCLSSTAAKQASFFIHVENLYASGRTKRPRGPRSSLTVTRPHIDVQTCAVAYYLRYHIQPLKNAPNISGCLSECVSAWRDSGRTSEMVDLALSSMALAVFSRMQSHPKAAAEAWNNYHRLLKVSQLWISQIGSVKLDATSIDACLLAISFMGRFEGAVYNVTESDGLVGSFPRLKSWCHHDGAMAVLKIRYDSRRPDENIASVIIKHTRRGILKSCLMRNRPLPDWLVDGQNFGEHGMELESDRIDVRVLALRQAYMKLENSIHSTPAEQLNDEAKEIDNALQDLVSRLPKSYYYQKHFITTHGLFPRRHFISPVVYDYQRVGYAAVWAQYFATRMLINRLRLRILYLSDYEHAHEQQRKECHEAIKVMGESLASTIPSCLERFCFDKDRPDSIVLNTNTDIPPYLINYVVWPLSIATGIEGLNATQLSWFRCELAALGKLAGDGVIESTGIYAWAIV